MTIQILPPQLANQIAAGEVVERPASVIKELVENSIDAGATHIDIDIIKGGMRLLRVRDNGSGVPKEELSLALKRYATSKIKCIDDLSAIRTLGFRGEALASISSVSRLTFTSRPASQSEAWQVFVEGLDHETNVKPASHPEGSTIEVQDLFYNTPARRRFMKTEKTELAHIDEVIKKIALSNPHIGFRVTNNTKNIHIYRGAVNDTQLERRIADICGNDFIANALKLEWDHNDIAIHGWINPDVKKEVTYFYVNHRAVRDPLINHAIKQALADNTIANKPGYVLYLELNPEDVDVNVHPTKREVRFHEARLIHDFIYHALQVAMCNHKARPEKEKNRLAAGVNSFDSAKTSKMNPVATINQQYVEKETRPIFQPVRMQYNVTSCFDVVKEKEGMPISVLKQQSTQLMRQPLGMGFGKVVTLWQQNYVIAHENDVLCLISLEKAARVLYASLLQEGTKKSSQKLLIPLRLELNMNEFVLWKENLQQLMAINIHFQLKEEYLQLEAVPALLRKLDWQTLMTKLSRYLLDREQTETITKEKIIAWLAGYYYQWSHMTHRQSCWTQVQAVALLTQLEQLKLPVTIKDSFMEIIDLSAPLTALQSK